MNLSLAAAGSPAGVQITMGFSNYGSSTPAVTAPAASEVAELPGGLPGLSG